ncbi:adhesion G-protein coupled receptor G6-like isoform X2 [Anneissia japonica]|uniref:adhesion G-protein coupled receptor G6-like isoform X2 n=1 Tax=Anneissia japonica TaxID=1529436 RepID=UPI00142571B8|nr:adhesion G-protein coupled receptor G6-like isoform X2 [Anneissia japonica]
MDVITTDSATTIAPTTIAPTTIAPTTIAPTTASVTHAQNSTTVFQNGTGPLNTTSETNDVATCPEETLTDLKGTFHWPETEGDTSHNIPCPYNSESFSTRKCLIIPETGTLEWGEMVTTKCAYENVMTRELQALASTEVTAENALPLSTMLMNMTASASSFTAADVELVVSVMENLGQNIAIYEDASRQVMGNVMDTASQMADGVDEQVLLDGEEETQSSTRILQNIDLFARDVDLNETTFGVSTMTFDIAVLDLVNTTITEDVVFVGGTGSQADLFVNTSSQNLATDDLTSITMPGSLFELDIGPIWRCQFVLFMDTIYFDIIGQVVNNTVDITDQTYISNNSTNSTELQNFSNETSSEPIRTNVLNSLVVSATLGNMEINDLLEPIAITLVHKQSENVGNPRCVFWNFTANGGMGGWSSEGCSVDSSNDTSTVCVCNHLTNFALLMDIYGDTAELPSQHQEALSYISYIGCGLSILGLSLTLLTYACCSLHYPKGDPRRRTKADKRVKILLNLVLALLMANIFFMMASLTVEFEELEDVCRIMAIFLHYFLLATMTWMALEAFNMYLSLVKVFEQYYSHFILKQMIFGWGVPLIFVIVTLSIDMDHYGFHSGACWLDRSAFYFAFMIPAVIILIFNFVVFTLVMKQLCNLRHSKITKTERFNAWSHLRGSISLMVLLGLTWAVAIFAVSEASLVFSYLFAILNSFQGLSIFIFHCLAKKDIRHNWRKLCCPCCAGPDEDFSSGGSSSKYRTGTKRQRMTWSTDARNHSSKKGGSSAKANLSANSNNTNSHTVSENSRNSYGTNGTVFNRPPSHSTVIGYRQTYNT